MGARGLYGRLNGSEFPYVQRPLLALWGSMDGREKRCRPGLGESHPAEPQVALSRPPGRPFSMASAHAPAGSLVRAMQDAKGRAGADGG